MQLTERESVTAIVLAGAATFWVGLLVAGPWLARASDEAAAILYLAGSLVCHQRADRSFHLAGAQLPVCARCLGLYGGAAAGLLIWVPIARRRPSLWPREFAIRALLVSGVPTGLTVATAWMGLGDPVNAWRAVLAVPLGVVGGLVAGAATTDHLK